MSEAQPPTEFIANTPDLKHLEVIGRLLLERGQTEHARFGNIPGLFHYGNSRISQNVTHTLTGANNTFRGIAAELTQSATHGTLLLLAHTEHRIFPNSAPPRQTSSYRALITPGVSTLKITHGVGKFNKHKALDEHRTIPLNNPYHPDYPELGYFTDCIERFILLAGIDISKAKRA